MTCVESVASTSNLILCAGVHRSGSTWLYNATRLILEAHCGACENVYGCWIGDYDMSHKARFHVVKLHASDEFLVGKAQSILTSRRDLRDIAASAWTQGWITNEEETLEFLRRQIEYHAFWLEMGALDISYGMIRKAPEVAIERIADHLGCTKSAIDPSSIESAIRGLPTAIRNETGYDSVTLLHERHKVNGAIGYYGQVLSAALITTIENYFGEWIQNFGDLF